MPIKDHYIIIGNGPAGNSAAEVLRAHDELARISIISDEGFSYYYRHMLCEFISGKTEEDKLKVKPISYYKAHDIRMRLGQQVEKIEPETKTLYLKHMEKVSFTKLILATGASPRVVPSLARFERHFSFMSKYTDAIKIKPMLSSVKKIAVLGGDLVSLKFAKMLSAMKKDVTFFLYKDCFHPFELTADMASVIEKRFSGKKINTYTELFPSRIEKKGEAFEMEMENGESLTVDMIFCFMGMKPNISFIQGSGIDTEKGVLVDEHLKTNVSDIYACGDCAQIYNPALKNYWISVGWENAGIQGETAALNLLGESKVIRPSKKKILDVEGLKVNTSWWKTF